MNINGLDEELMPLLDLVLPFKVEDSELTTSLTSAARYSKTNQLLVELLRVFVKKLKVLVLVIDDLQWCDKQSIAVLNEASTGVEGCFRGRCRDY